uniref:Uncharacterized protein n=1 Tax=Glossina brevipalpis TaxID=37001 RepID=A0A1A9WKP5_9MUSC
MRLSVDCITAVNNSVEKCPCELICNTINCNNISISNVSDTWYSATAISALLPQTKSGSVWLYRYVQLYIDWLPEQKESVNQKALASYLHFCGHNYPIERGHNCPKAPMGPLPVYCPIDNSINSKGMLQIIKIIQYGTKKTPEKCFIIIFKTGENMKSFRKVLIFGLTVYSYLLHFYSTYRGNAKRYPNPPNNRCMPRQIAFYCPTFVYVVSNWPSHPRGAAVAFASMRDYNGFNLHLLSFVVVLLSFKLKSRVIFKLSLGKDYLV